MRWRISGTLQEGGKRGTWNVKADTREDAIKLAGARGIRVSDVVPVDEDSAAAPVFDAPQQPGGTSRRALAIAAATVLTLVALGALVLHNHTRWPEAVPGGSPARDSRPLAREGGGAKADGNLLAGGANVESWKTYPKGTAEAIADGPAGALTLRVKGSGASPRSSGLFQKDLPLVDGREYALRFRAKSSKPMTGKVFVTTPGPEFRNVGLGTKIILSTAWQDFEFRFVATDPNASGNRLAFSVGEATCDVSLAEVSLRPVPEDANRLRATPVIGSWKTWAKDLAPPKLSVLDGALVAEVGEAGSGARQKDLYQPGVRLDEGQTYAVSFLARADTPGVLRVYASLHEGDFHTVGLSEDVQVGTEWKQYQSEFRATTTEGKRLRFGFGLGRMTGKVYFKDVSLQPKKG